MSFRGLCGFGFDIIYFFVEQAIQIRARLRTAARIERDLKLTRMFVIYPGEMDYALDDKIEAVAFKNLMRLLPTLG